MLVSISFAADTCSVFSSSAVRIFPSAAAILGTFLADFWLQEGCFLLFLSPGGGFDFDITSRFFLVFDAAIVFYFIIFFAWLTCASSFPSRSFVGGVLIQLRSRGGSAVTRRNLVQLFPTCDAVNGGFLIDISFRFRNKDACNSLDFSSQQLISSWSLQNYFSSVVVNFCCISPLFSIDLLHFFWSFTFSCCQFRLLTTMSSKKKGLSMDAYKQHAVCITRREYSLS